VVIDSLLINSASFISGALEAEFGRTVAALLPVGHRHLFELQLDMLGSIPRRIYLSLPEGLRLTRFAADRLERRNVQILWQPVGDTLATSIATSIERIAPEGSLHILHSDTLIDRPAVEDLADAFVVGTPAYYHRWATYRRRDGVISFETPESLGRSDDAVAGYFKISDPAQLRANLIAAGEWIGGLSDYARHRPIEPVSSAGWSDFGSHHSYHASKRHVSMARTFNRLSNERHTLTKSSHQHAKIMAEARWLDGLPSTLAVFSPKVLDSGTRGDEAYYTIPYLYSPTLSHLLLFSDLPAYAWQSVFESCQEFLALCCAPAATVEPDYHDRMYRKKTIQRLGDYSRARGVPIDRPMLFRGQTLPSLLQIAETTYNRIRPLRDEDWGILHGDFCASNIFYDFSAKRITVIDPRGLDPEGIFSLYGDRRYDAAKLAHSFIGRYDFILTGAAAAHLDVGPDGICVDFNLMGDHDAATMLFRETCPGGYDLMADGVYDIMLLLFLSMLPLHADDPARQDTLLANALRLFVDRPVSANG
jgi:hypothetical protein